LHEQCSLIITTNKSPQQWVETLEDEVLATALLDRLLFHCQVIKMKGESYRMENRKSIFNNDNTNPNQEQAHSASLHELAPGL
jgi:DNA replication protein DnaC